jgi:ATP-dependent Clp protease ATP-binding subunit ClpC
MFERFTEAAINSIMAAQTEMRELGHSFVGTEGFLLGLLWVRGGIAETVVTSYGLDLARCRGEVEAIIGHGNGPVAREFPFTPRAKRVLELAWDEAKQLNHNYIGTEHVLLGIIREGEGVAARVLSLACADLGEMRQAVLAEVERSQKESEK